MPDPAVVHVPFEALTFQQACDFKALLQSDSGRQQTINWLFANDAFVRSAYMLARESIATESGVEKAVIIALANTLRAVVTQQCKEPSTDVLGSRENEAR